MKKIFAAFLVLSVFAGALRAAETLTMEQCLARMEGSSPDILKARKALEASGQRVWQNTAGFLPVFSLGGMATHLNQKPPSINFSSILLGGPAPQIAGNPLLQYQFQDNYTAYFRITQPLFMGGRNMGLLRAAKADRDASRCGLGIARAAARKAVIRSFYGIIVGRESVKVTEEATAQLDRYLGQVRAFRKAGNATEYDCLKTEAQLASWSPRLAKARRDLSNGRKQLALALGMDEDADIEAGGELVYGGKDFQPMPLGEAKKHALEARPEMKLARAARELSESMNAVKLSGMLPQLGLQYNNNILDKKEAFGTSAADWQNWWDLRLVLNWDIFSSGRHLSEVRENRLKVEQAQIDETAAAGRVKAEVDDAYNALDESSQSVQAWGKSVELAEKGHELASNRYKAGSITNLEALDSHVSLLDAKLQYLKALYDYTVARAEYERAVGLEK